MDETQRVDAPRTLSDYAAVLRRRWWILVLGALLGGTAGGAVALMQPKVYQSSTSVIVQETATVEGTEPVRSRTNSGINLDTEAQLVKSEVVARAARGLLRTSVSEADLVERVSVTVPPNTQVLIVTFRGSTPGDAQAGSHAFAQGYLDHRAAEAKKRLDAQVATLKQQRAGLETQLTEVSERVAELPSDSGEREEAKARQRILSDQIATISSKLSPLQATPVTPGSIISDAKLPSKPTSPNLLLNIASGLFAGLLLGLGSTLLAERADGRLHGASEVRRLTELPVLVEIPQGQLRVAVEGHSSATARHFKQLRNAVLSVLTRQVRTSQARANVVLMLGVSPGVAPGVVAANLCVALAGPGLRVTLLCADPQSSSPALLGVGGARGLSDVLHGETGIGEAQQASPVCPGVLVVTPGTNAEPEELVPERLGKIVYALSAYSDYLVIETRPAGSSADGQALAGLAQLSFVVLEVNRTRRDDIGEVARQFDQVGSPLAGVVVVPEVKRGRPEPSPAAADRTPPRSHDGVPVPRPASRFESKAVGRVGSTRIPTPRT